MKKLSTGGWILPETQFYEKIFLHMYNQERTRLFDVQIVAFLIR